MNDASTTPAQLHKFSARVARVMKDLWDGYLERRATAESSFAPWDDAAERQAAATVGGTPLQVFDLTGDGLVSQWDWEGSDPELAENYVRDALSAFPTGQYQVPQAQLQAIIAMSDADFLAARTFARRREIGPDDEPRAGLG